MKKISLVSKRLLLFFLGIATFAIPAFLNTAEESIEEVTVEKRIEELKKQQVDPAIIAERLVAGIQGISKEIDLSPADKQRIDEQMKKLQQLIIEKKGPDKYTQSEAHLSLPFIRKLINQNYDIEPYLNIVSSALVKEAEFKRTHYVFYHAQDNVWRVPQELYRRLYERLSPIKDKVKDFVFLRWESPADLQVSARKFLVDQLVNYGLVNDNFDETSAVLLSANLALFGNVGFPGESSWEYFMNSKSHRTPKPSDFEGILDMFNISHKYIKELINLAYLLRTKEQTLLQIFIPKEIVDYVAYIAFLQGIPADKQTMDWVLENVPKKQRKTFSPYQKPLEKIRETFKTEQDKFPIFKELHERAEKGDFSVDALLKIYRNTPQLIDNINYLQARLVFTKDVLLTPDIGIKFFRYDKISQEQLQKFNQKLDELVDQMVQELLSNVKTKK